MILELGGCYQIRPANPGLMLYKHQPGGETITWGKYSGQLTKEKWVPMDRFPHDYAHALRLIAEDYGHNKEGKALVREGLEDIMNYVRDIALSAVILEEKVEQHVGS